MPPLELFALPDHLAQLLKSVVRARVEHIFAHQKERMGLFIRTIWLDRAPARIGLGNLAYNFCLWSLDTALRRHELINT